MRFNINQIKIRHSEKPEIILQPKESIQQIYSEASLLNQATLNGKELEVEIKVHRKKRSQDANSYCWVLCQKIAEVIKTTKEEVYRKAIRDVGQFQIVPIKAEAVQRWLECWGSHGIGWFAEVMDDSKLKGYKRVISYYGSSVYDTREMSVLVDCIVEEAKEIGIETMTPEELASLKRSWGEERRSA